MFNYFYPENRAFREIMSKNMLESDYNVIRRMRFTRWITKTTHTLTMCNSYCFSMPTVVTGKLLRLTVYVHCVICYTQPKHVAECGF
jgi:hypothetical protein